MSTFVDQFEKAKNAAGFIAALDQSGGSTPKALALYGVAEDSYSGEAEMFAAVHAMRTRIITNSAFAGDKILGAILFENTMRSEISGKPTARFLWEEKNIIPIIKVDQGLADETDGVQLMKPMPKLQSLLTDAAADNVFATKMRSVIKSLNVGGIKELVAQQFAVGAEIIARGLVPIIEPEVDIHADKKADIETQLRDEILTHLDALADDQFVMLKLTLPEQADFYAECVAHPRCLRVAALSGGYSREESCRRLAQNFGMIASFSRALSEGLSVSQSDDEFTAMLSETIATIAEASAT